MNYNSLISEHHSSTQLFICTFNDCKNGQRLLCQQCLKNHQHGQWDQQHLIEIMKFICDNMETNTETRKQLKHSLQQINHNHKIERRVLEKLLNINNIEQSELEQVQEYLNEVNKQQRNPELMVDKQQSFNNDDQKIVKENKCEENLINYDSYYYSQTKNRQLSSSISNSEQYLAYQSFTDEHQLIQLINIKMKKQDKKFNVRFKVKIQQFNNNSNLLFWINDKGYIYYLNIKSNLKQIRKFNTQIQFFSYLKVIKDRIIIQSYFKTIIIYDMITNSIINKFQDTDYIFSIDYDYNRQILVSSSLKFYDSKNQILVNQQCPHQQIKDTTQIQLVNQCKHLITKSSTSIKLWKIVYQTKCLLQLKEYQVFDQKYHFYSVCEDKKIVLLRNKKLQILDLGFNVIYETNHKIKDLEGNQFHFKVVITYIQQSNSINYILIMGIYSIQLLKKQ